MKSACFRKILIPCLAFVFSLSRTVASEFQNPSNVLETDQRLIKLHYENSSGENGITIFEYDANGIAQTTTWKLLDGTRYSHNYLTYDSSGNLILKYREFSDGLISFNRYEYDEKNNLVKETFERSDSVTGETVYHYDQEGLLEKADCRGLNGWFYGIIQYEYSHNRKESAKIISEGQQIGTIAYGYNASGNLLSETWEFQSGWSQHFIFEYEDYNLKVPPSFTSSNVFITKKDG